VKLAISMNLLTAVIIGGMDQLEAVNWSKIDNAMFHKVFGFYSIAFLASIIAKNISLGQKLNKREIFMASQKFKYFDIFT